MKLLALITAILFTPNAPPAQDISGVWAGNYDKQFLANNPQRLVVEIYVYNDSLITGASHLYYNNNQYEHYKINGVFKKRELLFPFLKTAQLQ